MGSIAAPPKHIVLHAHGIAWGHNKPLAAFAVLMLEKDQNVVITYLATAPLLPRIIGELGRLPQERYDAIKSRLNIIDISGPISDPSLPLEGFAPAFTALYKSDAVTCLSTGQTISGLPAPNLSIIDPFCPYAFESIRAIAGKTIPILCWWTAPVGALLRLFAPKSMGGLIEPELETPEGRAVWKAKIFKKEKIEIPGYGGTGEVVDGVAGLPPTYDYEWLPQQTALADLTPIIERIGAIYTRESEGLICVSSSAYEPEAVAAAKKWYESTGRVWYNVGPLAIHETNPKESVKSDTDKQVVEFLDRMQKEHGEKSLTYISFGTFFFPVTPEKIWAVFDELIANNSPFVFAHPSPLSTIPDEIKTKIADSGLGMELPWSPQEIILSHPVTGWFITHGGWNSMQEAFVHRVPLILWPYQADQPYNATLLTLRHKAAFELIEVRTGEKGTKMPYRCKDASTPPAFTVESTKAEFRAVLEKTKGEEGALVRKNFEAIAYAMGKTWDEGGEAKSEMDALFKKFVH